MHNFLLRKGVPGAFYFVILLFLWTIIGGVLLYLEEAKSIYIMINGLHTPFWDALAPYISHIGTFPVIAACLFGLFLFKRFLSWKFVLGLVLCNLIPFLLVQGLKNIFNAPRPLNYFKHADWIHKVAGQPENLNLSFPSGHSEGAFALCCFLALLLPKKWELVGILLFFAALATAFSRIYLSQHFFADIYVGSLIGAYSVLFIFLIMRLGKWSNGYDLRPKFH